MSDRVPCRRPGCSYTILPSTAERTGGLCMPCVNAAASAEHERYLEANRGTIDRFRDVKDTVEHILLLHEPVPVDEFELYAPSPRTAAELYGELTAADIERLLTRARKDPELLREIGAHLAHVSALPLGAVQRTFLAENLVYPGYVFRDAPDTIVEELIRRVDGFGAKLDRLIGRADHSAAILDALAWSRHPKAIASFRRWTERPPGWSRASREAMTKRLAEHTRNAGYELVDGGIRELVDLRAQVLSFEPPQAGTDARMLRLFERVAGPTCPYCGSRPWHLVREMTPESESVIATCPSCVATEFVFAHHDFAARGWAYAAGVSPTRPRREPWDLPVVDAHVGATRSPFASVDTLMDDLLSQIGGHPTWLSGEDYPRCPSCEGRMPFVLQICLDQVDAEGFIWAFRCDACNIVATRFGQT